jgi:hypothetical protein
MRTDSDRDRNVFRHQTGRVTCRNEGESESAVGKFEQLPRDVLMTRHSGKWRQPYACGTAAVSSVAALDAQFDNEDTSSCV